MEKKTKTKVKKKKVSNNVSQDVSQEVDALKERFQRTLQLTQNHIFRKDPENNYYGKYTTENLEIKTIRYRDTHSGKLYRSLDFDTVADLCMMYHHGLIDGRELKQRALLHSYKVNSAEFETVLHTHPAWTVAMRNLKDGKGLLNVTENEIDQRLGIFLYESASMVLDTKDPEELKLLKDKIVISQLLAQTKKMVKFQDPTKHSFKRPKKAKLVCKADMEEKVTEEVVEEKDDRDYSNMLEST